MPSLFFIFAIYFAVLALAAPSTPMKTLAKRQSDCTVESAIQLAQDDDTTCTGRGSIIYQGRQINSYRPVDFYSCQKACKRNYACVSTEFNSQTSTCRLMDSVIEGFKPNPNSARVYSSTVCWALTGNCPFTAGSFEGPLQNSTVPRYRAMAQPWTLYNRGNEAIEQSGHNVASVETPSTMAVVSQHPLIIKPPVRDGKNFLAATIRNAEFDVAIRQAMNYPFNIWGYRISYDYNFAKFVKSSPGAGVPKQYAIVVYSCFNVVDEFLVPVAAAENKWKTHRTRDLQIHGQCAEDIVLGIYPFVPLEEAAAPEAKFTAIFGIDALNITAIPATG